MLERLISRQPFGLLCGKSLYESTLLDSIKGPVEMRNVSWKLEIINQPGFPMATHVYYITKY
ncbi:Uncharacterized protein APZ42_000010 [Daphnia magna]|uniref:Uncharacterized protein n=1 Tax=Daphnia magna TaxID=35525 RepID=A0A0N8D7V4_9CRUS|nr:Uncharacterized protein APZ42_000010 [Daphnia magna]